MQRDRTFFPWPNGHMETPGHNVKVMTNDTAFKTEKVPKGDSRKYSEEGSNVG